MLLADIHDRGNPGRGPEGAADARALCFDDSGAFAARLLFLRKELKRLMLLADIHDRGNSGRGPEEG